jgi:hypothetical protein
MLLLFFQIGCGLDGEQKVTAGGTTTSNVYLNMPFIEEIRLLCEEAVGPNQTLVAECTLANIQLLNIGISGDIELVCSFSDISLELALALCGG